MKTLIYHFYANKLSSFLWFSQNICIKNRRDGQTDEGVGSTQNIQMIHFHFRMMMIFSLKFKLLVQEQISVF